MGPHLTLLIVLLLAGVWLALLTAYLMARGLVRPPRMNDGKALYVLRRLTPRDLDLDYENLSFEVRDEKTGRPIKLAAWWIPNLKSEISNLKSHIPDLKSATPSSSGTVILVHGYADAKVGSIAWAPPWHELGFNVLAIDL